MPQHIVISAILPTMRMLLVYLLGTVDGNTIHRWDKPFNPTELTPAAVAQAFLDAYARMDQLVVQKIASRTINVTLARSTTAVAVVFGTRRRATSRPYDQAIFVATVGGVTYYCTARERSGGGRVCRKKTWERISPKKIAQAMSAAEAGWLLHCLVQPDVHNQLVHHDDHDTSTTTTTTTTTTSTTTTTHTLIRL